MLPISHDESISYFIVNSIGYWKLNPNNHLLNTALMWCSEQVFGQSAIALRIPNVLAFIPYAWFGFRILRPLRWHLAILGMWLLMNPFVLDFFSLARGYGLSLAFFMAIIYQLQCFYEKRHLRRLTYAVLLSACCFSANLSMLMPLAALMLIAGVSLIRNGELWTYIKGHFPALLIAIAGAVPGLWFLFYLKSNNQLYIGGKTGFFSDTLVTLVEMSRYRLDYGGLTDEIVAGIIGGAGIAMLVWFAMRFNLVKRAIVNLTVSLVCTVLFLLIGFYLMDLPLPRERVGVYLIPFVSIMVILLISEIRNRAMIYITGGLITLAAVPHYTRTRTVDYFTECFGSRYDNEIMDRLEEEKLGRVGISWGYEPLVNFHRNASGMEWIDSISRGHIYRESFDIYVLTPKDLDSLQTLGKKLEIIEEWKDTGTVIAKPK